MPPFSRKYGIVTKATAPNLVSISVKASTSSTSLSLADIMASMNYSDYYLLGDLSLDSDMSSICSDSFESIPLFPAQQSHSLVHFADLRSSIFCSPRKANEDQDECFQSTVSIPTARRLRAILGEVVNVKRWTVCNISLCLFTLS